MGRLCWPVVCVATVGGSGCATWKTRSGRARSIGRCSSEVDEDPVGRQVLAPERGGGVRTHDLPGAGACSRPAAASRRAVRSGVGPTSDRRAAAPPRHARPAHARRGGPAARRRVQAAVERHRRRHRGRHGRERDRTPSSVRATTSPPRIDGLGQGVSRRRDYIGRGVTMSMARKATMSPVRRRGLGRYGEVGILVEDPLGEGGAAWGIGSTPSSSAGTRRTPPEGAQGVGLATEPVEREHRAVPTVAPAGGARGGAPPAGPVRPVAFRGSAGRRRGPRPRPTGRYRSSILTVQQPG